VTDSWDNPKAGSSLTQRSEIRDQTELALDVDVYFGARNKLTRAEDRMMLLYSVLLKYQVPSYDVPLLKM
jgi:hypothetical protein